MSDQVKVAADDTTGTPTGAQSGAVPVSETPTGEAVNPQADATQENEPQAEASAESVEVTGAALSSDARETPVAEAEGEATEDEATEVTAELLAPEVVEAQTVVVEPAEPQATMTESEEVIEPELIAPEVVEAQTVVTASEEVVESPEVAAPEAEAAETVAAEAATPVAEQPVAEQPVAEQSEAVASHESADGFDQADDTDSSDDSVDADGKRVVRVLSVGQEITGTVKRIAEFGAFIDIGVGRDGLIHISELSSRRVGKVTDVLQEGQEITAWIKKLDRDRNRISLTLIDPGTKTIRDLSKGDLVQGTVTRIMPYGAFIDIGIGRDALLHIREMAQGYVGKPEDVVKVGEPIEARVVDLSRRRSRVDLSLKGLRPEPEQEAPAAQSGAESQPEPEEITPDPYDQIEVLSPMELAFKRAVEAGGGEIREGKGKRGKQRGRNLSIQEEIIARTLDSGRK